MQGAASGYVMGDSEDRRRQTRLVTDVLSAKEQHNGRGWSPF